MNNSKRITLTGYLVKYADLRKPKPRTVREGVYLLEKEDTDGLGILGLNVADFITARYERCGYHVTSVERIRGKRVASVDLRQLWEDAGKDLQEKSPTTSDGEDWPE